MPKNKDDILLRDHIFEFRQLLKEYVSRNELTDAINNREIVKIRYQGEETERVGWRTIEPFVLGVSSAGNIVLRAWQQAGDSDGFNGVKRTPRMGHERWNNYHNEGPSVVPGWRLFRLDGIKQIMYTGKNFDSTDAQKLAKYNPNDGSMGKILTSAIPFDPNKVKIKGVGDLNPNITQQNVSVFDKQTKGWKNIPKDERYDQLKLKSTILSIANFVERKQKEALKKWMVFNDGNKILPIRDNPKNREKYKDQILGNLESLYTQYFGSIKQDKSRFLKSRRDFENALKNYKEEPV